jgi:hypothetical protein
MQIIESLLDLQRQPLINILINPVDLTRLMTDGPARHFVRNSGFHRVGRETMAQIVEPQSIDAVPITVVDPNILKAIDQDVAGRIRRRLIFLLAFSTVQSSHEP